MCAERRQQSRAIEEALSDAEALRDSIRIFPEPSPEEAEAWHDYMMGQEFDAELERVRPERQPAHAMS